MGSAPGRVLLIKFKRGSYDTSNFFYYRRYYQFHCCIFSYHESHKSGNFASKDAISQPLNSFVLSRIVSSLTASA